MHRAHEAVLCKSLQKKKRKKSGVLTANTCRKGPVRKSWMPPLFNRVGPKKTIKENQMLKAFGGSSIPSQITSCSWRSLESHAPIGRSTKVKASSDPNLINYYYNINS